LSAAAVEIIKDTRSTLRFINSLPEEGSHGEGGIGAEADRGCSLETYYGQVSVAMLWYGVGWGAVRPRRGVNRFEDYLYNLHNTL